MVKKDFEYKQCRLEKTGLKGSRLLVTWLPLRYAKQGKVLRLKNDLGHWDSGWLVMVVGERSQSASHLRLHNRDGLKLH